MAEYINRASLINHLNTFAPEHYNSLVNDLILKEPAADVVERKKGSWAKTTMTDFGYTFPVVRCTACGTVFSTFLEDVNFCPNCGADMRGET